jgi:hypothetical protein
MAEFLGGSDVKGRQRAIQAMRKMKISISPGL